MQIFTGVAEDVRSKEEKNKDWQAEEILGTAAPYTWKDFKEEDIPQYTIRNQNGSGECGAFAISKALGINNLKDTGTFINLRPEFVYTKRTNKGPGMMMQEMFEIACKYGAPEDVSLQGDNLSEDQANAYTPTQDETTQALKYKGKNYVFMSSQNIDAIALAIQNGYTPIFLLRCDISEWTSEPHVGNFKSPFNINHYVPAIYAGMSNGVKTIVIDDSWGSSYGKNGHRYLSEEFINTRIEATGYIVDLPEIKPVDTKPHHTFSRPLVYGMKGKDIVYLQDILKYEGCMSNKIPSTGNYLNLTAQAVMKLQLKNSVASQEEITQLKGRRVGLKTLNYLKKYE